MVQPDMLTVDGTRAALAARRRAFRALHERGCFVIPNPWDVGSARYLQHLADQKPVAEVAKKHGISDQTIYAWRQRYGTLEAADVKRLRQLEQENGRLKKMVADRDLEIDVLKEIRRKPW